MGMPCRFVAARGFPPRRPRDRRFYYVTRSPCFLPRAKTLGLLMSSWHLSAAPPKAPLPSGSLCPPSESPQAQAPRCTSGWSSEELLGFGGDAETWVGQSAAGRASWALHAPLSFVVLREVLPLLGLSGGRYIRAFRGRGWGEVRGGEGRGRGLGGGHAWNRAGWELVWHGDAGGGGGASGIGGGTGRRLEVIGGVRGRHGFA